MTSENLILLPPDGSGEVTASIYDYAARVLRGEELACKKIKLACERFFRDLRRSEDQDYPWRFDWELAERPTLFMEKQFVPPKGDYDAMTLLPWQRFFFGNIYGWVGKADGLRRFREALCVVGRGNGKSTMVGGGAAFGVCKDGERGADCFLLANGKEQSKLTFDAAAEMIKASRIASRFKVLRSEIRYPATNGTIEHRASDSRRLDGLNPSMGVFDELHEYHEYKLINVIKRGMNKRRQPLCIYITTMGTVLDGPLMDYYGLFTAAMTGDSLRPEVSDRMFALIYEMDADDDIEDWKLWGKANPSLGTLLHIEQLRDDWERSKHVPQEKADFICKQLNIFTNSSDAKFVDFEVLRRNEGMMDEAALEGRDCFAGIDMALTEDFTSVALAFPLEDGRLYWMQHSWTPRKKAELDNEKIPYYEWQMMGHLSIVDDDYVHYEDVLAWFLKMREKYHIISVGYDIANAQNLIRALEGEGFNCQAVRQGSLTLNGPMKDLRERLLDGKIIMNRNPMCRWYLDNVKIHQTSKADADKENWMPTKASRYQKIDGFAALLDAHCEMLRMNGFALPDYNANVRVISLDGLNPQTDDASARMNARLGDAQRRFALFGMEEEDEY